MNLYKYGLTSLLLLFSFAAGAQSLSVRFDLSQARQTLALLKADSVTAQQADHFLEHPGTRALVSKVRSQVDTARSALFGARAGRAPSPQERRFRWTGIFKYRDTLSGFLETLERRGPAIADSITQALLPYAPPGKTTHVTVYALYGGPSMGFTLGDDTAFYIGLQFYNFDVQALIESCKHELLHNLQAARYDTEKITIALERRHKGAAMAYRLLTHLFREGSAEWLADLRRLERTPKVRELVEHAEVNDGRNDDAFYLVQRMLLDAYLHPDSAAYDRSYSLLFDWNWNNPGYYVGYRMMKALEAAKGPGVLQRYIAADPTVFIQEYLLLDKKVAPGSFSPAFAEMIKDLQRKVRNVAPVTP